MHLRFIHTAVWINSLFLFFLIEVLLIYNVVLISALHESTAKRFIYTYIFLNILFHYALPQDIEYSSQCYTVGLCCLSIL